MRTNISEISNSHASRQAATDQATSEALLRSIDLHARSSARDLRDAQFDSAAITNDKASLDNATKVQNLDQQILSKLGKKGVVGSLSPELVKEALAAHQQSRILTQRDLDGPTGGIGSNVSAGNDQNDSADEKALMKSNNGLMGKNISTQLKAQLDWENTNKSGLQYNDNKDAKLEPAYTAHDTNDLKFDKVVTDALSGHIHLSHDNLVALFKGDVASKTTIAADRKTDYANEQKYRQDDMNDHQQNIRINSLLQAELAKSVY